MPKFSHTIVRHKSKVEVVKEASKGYRKGPTEAYQNFYNLNKWELHNYSGFYSKDLDVILHIEDGGYISDLKEGPIIPVFHHHYTFTMHEHHHYRMFALFITNLQDFSLDEKAISLTFKGERYSLSKLFGPIIGQNSDNASEYYSKYHKHLPVTRKDPVIKDSNNIETRLSDECQLIFGEFGKIYNSDGNEYCYLLEFNIHNINPQNTFYITLKGMNAEGKKLEPLKLRLSDQINKEYRMMEIHL